MTTKPNASQVEYLDGWTVADEIAGQPVSLKRFAARGATDYTLALTAAIEAINAGEIASLALPVGTVRVSAALPAITASAWAITGAGIQTTRLLMDAGAGSLGTFFTVGNATLRPSVWHIAAFDMYYENLASLNGAGNSFNLVNCAQGTIDRVKSWRGNGLITFGSSALSTLCNNTNITNARCISHAPAGGKAIDLQGFAGGKFVNCNFSANPGALSSFRGLHARPTATDTADTMKFVNCEWNYPESGVTTVIEYDGTNSSLGNQQFVNCVFDQAVTGQNIWAHIDAAPSANAKLNLYFTNCISNGSTNATAVTIENIGLKPLMFVWNGGQLSQAGNSGRTLRAVGGAGLSVKISNAEINSRSAGAPVTAVAIGDNTSGVQITNCTVRANYSNAETGATSTPFQNFITFEGAATNCVIKDNDFSQGASNFIKWDAQPVTGLETLRISDNIGPNGSFPFVFSTLADTPGTVYSYEVAEDRLVVLKARLSGRQAGIALLARAYYEPMVAVYRIAGANAIVQGSATPIAIESGAALDASWVLSGNTVSLVCTPPSGQPVRWKFDIEALEQ